MQQSAVAVVGVGITEFSRASGQTPLHLAVRAARDALHDAGLGREDVDGIVGYHRNDSCSPVELAEGLAVPSLDGYAELLDGGPGSVVSLGVGAAMIEAGQCDVVLCYRALNGRSGKRIGQYGATSADPLFTWMADTGLMGIPTWYATSAQAYLDVHGLDPDAFWPVVSGLRRNAADNPNALMREPLSYDEYVAARMIATPLRLYDCCLETDAACVVVLARADVAQATRAPVWLRGWGTRAPLGSAAPNDQWHSATESAVTSLAPAVFRRAGVALSDIRCLQVYDNTSFSVCALLEDLGVCPRGGAPAYVAEHGVSPQSPLPVNTNGGMLNEGHIHGLNGVVEIVRQVRGEAGARQVEDCDTACVVAWGFPRGALAVLGAQR